MIEPTSARATSINTMPHKKWKLTKTWCGIAFRIYLLLVLLLMLFETNLIYPAPRYPVGDWNAAAHGAEDVFFRSADGTQLHGWYFDRPQAQGYLMYCHGNGEHVAGPADFFRELSNRYNLAVFVFDYRGYGRSEGKPDEAGVLADADAAQKWLAEKANQKPEDIILYGRSLGGGIAVDLAASNGARGVILWGTFTSLPDTAAVHYPWFPVRWLMRNRYDSLSKIGSYRGPLLQFHGTNDEVVPYTLGEKLFHASKSEQKKFVPLVGETHNGPPPPLWYAEVAKFIRELP